MTRDDKACAFYAARDKRTFQLGATETGLSRPLTLRIDGELGRTRAGQVAVLALVDMLFRVHRDVRLELPPTITAAGDRLDHLAISAAAAIDPFQNPLRDPLAGEIRVHLTGRPDTSDADVVGTWSGGRGEVHIGGARPIGAAAEPLGTDGDVLGAATAACLVASAAFTLAHGDTPIPSSINLLTMTSGADTTRDAVEGPVDVGTVDVIGGGAVGHALTYWVNVFGLSGAWRVIDGDDAELHNTNRCMGMTASDAGWPGGVHTGTPLKKAASAARNCNAESSPVWYDELPDARQRPDLVIVLANERGIRANVAQSGVPLLLHATTSPNWTAELHRHVPGRDDCPACRIPATTKAAFACSEGPAQPTAESSSDAALPFLSAAAGLMLCSALLDLGDGQRVLSGRVNHWVVCLDLPIGPPIQANIHKGNGCPHHLPADTRDLIQADHPRRWDFVDN